MHGSPLEQAGAGRPDVPIDGLGRGRLILILALALTLNVLACQSPPDDSSVAPELDARGLPSIERPEGQTFELPAGILLDDGLDPEEAVAIALWNDGAFRSAVTDLELAAADRVEAGLLPNPRLQVYFPVGPKQFEGVLGWAFDGLWARPWRVDAAELAFRAQIQRLVATAVDTRTRVQRAHVEASLAAARARFASERSERLDRLLAIVADRARRGQVSELDKAGRLADAARAQEDAAQAILAARDARFQLLDAIGADAAWVDFDLAAGTELPEPPGVDALLESASHTHPAIEAARLELESAAERLGWERRNLVRFTALLDANEDGKDGFEIGPGLEIELPIFDRNQAGIARADARLDQAAWAYAAKRREVGRAVSRHHVAYAEARAALLRWQAEPLAAFRREVELARAAERTGSIAYTDVIGAELRFIDARARSVELEAAARLARIELEASIGRRLDAEN